MTVRWTVRAANDRSRDRAARVKSHLQLQKPKLNPCGLVLVFCFLTILKLCVDILLNYVKKYGNISLTKL